MDQNYGQQAQRRDPFIGVGAVLLPLALAFAGAPRNKKEAKKLRKQVRKYNARH